MLSSQHSVSTGCFNVLRWNAFLVFTIPWETAAQTERLINDGKAWGEYGYIRLSMKI
jgi:hypothetical protein